MTSNYKLRPLGPELLEDFLHFFDNVAYTDHPEWSHCYCCLHHYPHDTAAPWKTTTREGNRETVIKLINERILKGYLAFAGDDVVAWCNAGPRTGFTTAPEDNDPLAPEIGSVMCFLVAPGHRGKGLARIMLQRACEDFHTQGFNFAEGYPIIGVEGQFANHCGPQALFERFGFQIVGRDEEQHIMRRTLPL